MPSPLVPRSKLLTSFFKFGMVTPVDTPRSIELLSNYNVINEKVLSAGQRTIPPSQPRLVAVSKVKPASDILALHQHGIIHFGENYVQELFDKAQILPETINWHFIGALQSNKCKLLASIPNLYAIETLSSIKSADLLCKGLTTLSPPRPTRLNVFIQINTSAEEAKAGLKFLTAQDDLNTISEVVNLAKHILKNCPSLRLKGLMTIGSYGASASEEDNPDFISLVQTRTSLISILENAELNSEAMNEISKEGLELSMGMSGDFTDAIRQGSTNVRVGSSIFGARPPFKPAAA